jgi:hypothetical protein
MDEFRAELATSIRETFAEADRNALVTIWHEVDNIFQGISPLTSNLENSR